MKYDYSETVENLLHWFDYNARILPWREDPTPYNVWISEIMLQQTRVEAVRLYFERFIERIPDIKALAHIDEEELLKLWEGLGYYNRARNLKKAAQMVMKEYGGKLPADYDKLLQLPGIGSYTAGAIASLAFQIPRPAVDGNVLRVMKRVEGSFDDITKARVKKDMEQDLLEIMPKDRPGDYNQAIMDLGATICIPNGKPLCDICPLMHICKAFHNQIQMEIPVKKKKKERRIEDKTVLLLQKGNRYAIQKRKKSGLLPGLWELPNLEGKLSILALEEKLNEMGYNQVIVHKLGESKHIFSHIEWHMIGYHVILDNQDIVLEDSPYIANKNKIEWVSKQEVDEYYSLPTAFGHYKKGME